MGLEGGWLTATGSGDRNQEFGAASGPESGLVVVTGHSREPFGVALEIVAHTPNWGGTKWFLLCPEADCGRRALRLYVDVLGQRDLRRGRVTGDSNPDEPLRLGPGDACIVGHGEWHQVHALEPVQLLHITPGPGGDHRPR